MPDPQPISWGSISQGMPLFKTNRIPVRTARSSMRGLPPLGLGGSSGKSGSITSHSSSVTSGLAIFSSYPPPGFVRRTKKAIHEITEADNNKKEAAHAIEAFASEFGTKWPKAVAKITQEKELLLTFYEFPAEHWVHLRTTNPIESTFAPVRARTDVTKGPGSRAAGVAMIFKLMEAAEGRWRRISGAHLVPLVRAGAQFVNGELVERNEEKDAA